MDTHSSDLDADGDFLPEDATPTADDPAAFGQFLREARERRQLTLQQVASETQISSRDLNALEDGNMAALPGGMYRRAMLRAYADSVGIPRDAALEQFERTFEADAAADRQRLRREARPVHEPAADPTAAEPPAAVAPATIRADVPATVRPAAMTLQGRGLKLVGLIAVAVVVVALIRDDSARNGVADAMQAGTQRGPASAPPPAASETPAPAEPAPPAVRATPPAPVGAADDTSARTGPSPLINITAPAADRPQMPSESAGAAQAARLEPVRPAPVTAPPATPGAAPAGASTLSGSAPPAAPRRASSGEIVVTSEPSGARVTINGTGWGVTPVTVRHLTFGAKTVRVTKDGYATAQRAVVLDPTRASARVSVTLSARGQ